ncbi:MAG TPA: hypothetical protein DDW52_02525, partial [Planctomycetaceae bacterium]|nr:hypothetical protein [Planctomycetaceae bacterium]
MRSIEMCPDHRWWIRNSPDFALQVEFMTMHASRTNARRKFQRALLAAFSRARAAAGQALKQYLPGRPRFCIRTNQRRRHDARVFEYLESRHLLAGVTVTAFNDVVNGDMTSIAALVATPGPDGISLREAIIAANETPGLDTINFSGAGSILLENGALELSDSNRTTIEGNGLVTVDAADQSIVFVVNEDATATLSGLTISGGGFQAYPVDSLTSGAGIFNAGTLQVRNSVVTRNTANDNGGGIHNSIDGDLTIVGSEISHNFATNVGGGVNNFGTVTIIDSTITSNSSGDGGGLSSGVAALPPAPGSPPGPDTEIKGDVTIIGSTVSNNSATENAGGIYNVAGVVRIDSSTIADNVAYNPNRLTFPNAGGGVFTTDELIVSNSTIRGNQGDLGGGLTVGFDGNAFVTNTTISSNIWANQSVRLSGAAGGVYVQGGGKLDLVNSTVFGNTGWTLRGGTGGLFNAGEVTLNNTVVAGSVGSFPGVEVRDLTNNGVLLGSNNLVQDGQGTLGLTGTRTGNPFLGPLADNGGPTLTHQPILESPLLNAGNNALAVDSAGQPLQTDQRGSGFVRQSGNVDIGAVELQVVDSLVVTTTEDIVALDGQVSLREAVSRAGASDVITFADELGAATINVTQGRIPLNSGFVIDGEGDITIDAGGNSRVFRVSNSASVELRGLTITGGNSGGNSGGAIWMDHSTGLTIIDSHITGNTASGGGAISQRFSTSGPGLLVINSTISDNTAT